MTLLFRRINIAYLIIANILNIESILIIVWYTIMLYVVDLNNTFQTSLDMGRRREFDEVTMLTRVLLLVSRCIACLLFSTGMQLLLASPPQFHLQQNPFPHSPRQTTLSPFLPLHLRSASSSSSCSLSPRPSPAV